MTAVTITQITPSELELLISNVLLKHLSNKELSIQSKDEWFNLDQICKYLPDKPVNATVYGWVSKRLIPYHKKSKSLSFLKSEIDQWLKEGLYITAKQMTKEIEKETDSYLANKKVKQLS
jgi:hypothetical protein